MKLNGTYTIELTGMRFLAPVGVSSDERKAGSEVIVNLSIEVSANSEAFASDDCRQVLDYSEVYKRVSLAMKKPCSLIEHAAYSIAEDILRMSQVESVEVSLSKVNPPVGADGLKATVKLKARR